MSDNHRPRKAGGVSLQLLDSSQGKPIQTWRFSDQAEITIGREDTRDIVISDPHVSRHHVTLFKGAEGWTLVSCGRHGTLIDNRMVVEATLRPGVIFRLGPSGPMLRFDTAELSPSGSMTVDQIDIDALALFELDQEKNRLEADKIASGSLFDELLQESQRLKSARHDGGKGSGSAPRSK
ncbi:MAG: FHA domain-containing protein [Pirellulales bacterium]